MSGPFPALPEPFSTDPDPAGPVDKEEERFSPEDAVPDAEPEWPEPMLQARLSPSEVADAAVRRGRPGCSEDVGGTWGPDPIPDLPRTSPAAGGFPMEPWRWGCEGPGP